MATTISGTAAPDFPVPVTKAEGGSGLTAFKAVIQSVRTDDGNANSGAVITPIDDTIPENTEGNEFITVTITPTKATNKLIIESQVFVAGSIAGYFTMALHQDAIVNALTASGEYKPSAGLPTMLNINHEMIAGTTSATTFKIRCGVNSAGTCYFNGRSATRQYGGVMNSYIKVTEIEA